MNGYMKSTGKKYNRDMVKCSSCGEIYCFDADECPKCKSREREDFQRTLATIKDEKEAQDEK